MLPLAVDRHRRGDEHLVDRIALLHDLLEHDGAAERVHGRVALDLVHRLADTDRGSEVDDALDAVERRGDGVVVAHVGDDQLDLRVEVCGALASRVHLRIERVEDAHTVPALEQAIREMGADEPGAAGDQELHRTSIPAGVKAGQPYQPRPAGSPARCPTAAAPRPGARARS